MEHIDPRRVERLAERERIRAAIERRIEAWIALLDRIDGDPDLEPSNGKNGCGVDDDAEADNLCGVSDDEPWLGWTPLTDQSLAMNFITERVGSHEQEDGADDELSLGWATNTSQLRLGDSTEDGDKTAPERHGRGFVRCGADDAEPTLGAPERHPNPCGLQWEWVHSQEDWAGGSDVNEREDVSEDEGACVQSQPHDENTDDEPWLGWTEAGDLGSGEDSLGLCEAEDYVGGYGADIARRFRTADVRAAVQDARQQAYRAEERRQRRHRESGLLSGPGTLPGGIPIVGWVR